MHRQTVTQVDVGRKYTVFLFQFSSFFFFFYGPLLFDLLHHRNGITREEFPSRPGTGEPTTSGPKNSRPSGRRKKKKKKKTVLLERKATHIQTYLILERRERNGGIKGDDGDIRRKVRNNSPPNVPYFLFSLSRRAGARPRWAIKNNKRLKVESPVP